jgi:hypothetical protein
MNQCLKSLTLVPPHLNSREPRGVVNSVLTLESSLKIFEDFSLCKDFLHNLLDKGKGDYFGKKEAQMLKNFPIRVAIIDTGIDVRTSFENIKEGISFTRTASGEGFLPWWMVADAHGTQMASLVRNVNPYCRLYPVRVGMRTKDIDSDGAARVSQPTAKYFIMNQD